MNIEDAPVLIEGLKDPRDDVRHEAAVALERLTLAFAAAVPALGVAQQDPNPEVGRAATRALGQMVRAGIAAVPALYWVEEDSDPEVRNRAALVLTKVATGSAFVPEVPDDDWGGNDALGG